MLVIHTVSSVRVGTDVGAAVGLADGIDDGAEVGRQVLSAPNLKGARVGTTDGLVVG